LHAQDRFGAGTLQGLFRPSARLAERGGRNEAEADRYSGAPAASVERRMPRSAWEEPERNLRQGFFRDTLRGQNPREHPVVGALILHRSPGTLGRVKAQKPRPVGPAHRFGGGITGGRNGMWVLPRGNAADTFREEKAPKGKSHERRRCETKPAGARRA
jgi:hypothetical protein